MAFPDVYRLAWLQAICSQAVANMQKTNQPTNSNTLPEVPSKSKAPSTLAEMSSNGPGLGFVNYAASAVEGFGLVYYFSRGPGQCEVCLPLTLTLTPIQVAPSDPSPDHTRCDCL